MRIAVNTRFLLPGRLEGIGWFTHEVVKRLLALRPADEFIFLFDRPFDPSFVFTDQITPVVVPPPARHPVLWYTWFEWSLPYYLRKHRADVFFSPDGYCSLRASLPTVMVTHDIAHRHYPNQIPPLVRHYYDYFVPRYLQRAQQIVTVSQFCRQDILNAYPVVPEKISVACNGVRPHFQPTPLSDQHAIRQRYSKGKPYFFYLGAIHPRKNLPRLLAAYDLFRQQVGADVKLLIGGRFAWQTSEINTTYQQAKFRDDIHFLGFVADEELPGLIGSALALTYVSLFEGFGVPILEAMHCDTAVITSNVTAMPEVGGEAALLVDPRKESSIAKAMVRVYEDENLRNTLVSRAREQRQAFSWDKATEIVDAALNRLTF